MNKNILIILITLSIVKQVVNSNKFCDVANPIQIGSKTTCENFKDKIVYKNKTTNALFIELNQSNFNDNTIIYKCLAYKFITERNSNGDLHWKKVSKFKDQPSCHKMVEKLVCNTSNGRNDALVSLPISNYNGHIKLDDNTIQYYESAFNPNTTKPVANQEQ